MPPNVFYLVIGLCVFAIGGWSVLWVWVKLIDNIVQISYVFFLTGNLIVQLLREDNKIPNIFVDLSIFYNHISFCYMLSKALSLIAKTFVIISPVDEVINFSLWIYFIHSCGILWRCALSGINVGTSNSFL